MARIRFAKGQGIRELSGTLGNWEFRVMNGKTFVHERRHPVLPKGASRAEKARYRRRMMVDECVRILQDEIDDIAVAVGMRKKIRDRVKRLYEQYVREIKAPTKLQCKIMGEYRARYRFASESSPRKRSKKSDKVSQG